MYQRLLDAWGVQGWWPGHTRFELLVGSVGKLQQRRFLMLGLPRS